MLFPGVLTVFQVAEARASAVGPDHLQDSSEVFGAEADGREAGPVFPRNPAEAVFPLSTGYPVAVDARE